ncbi:MAG: FctA domain-containing protein, partial [Erysipelotrichaceae bacterium]|nr:FctA domain-containing protein [Erysipelotrichaceae bacterium]
SSTTDEPLTFNNTYNVKPVVYDPPVKKNLAADDGLTPPDIEGKFTFTIAAKDPEDAPLPENTVITNSSTYEVSDGLYEFGDIEYTKPGKYTYTVTETGKVDGITNDTEASKTVTVEVTDNGDGTLSFKATDTVDNPVTFTNTYTVKEITASFPVTKDLVVPEGLTGPDKWSYTIDVKADKDDTPVAKVMSGTVSNENDTVTFGEFTYTKPGTYTYTVSETGNIDGVTNDAEAAGKKVTVTVKDNSDGTLTATVEPAAGITFTNTYGTSETTATFPAKKVLKLANEKLSGPSNWEFTFTATAADGSPVGDTMSGTVTKDSDTVTFGTFTFTTPGTYTYTVAESGSVDGVTNDAESEKTVTIEVVDNGNGTMTAKPTSTEGNPLTFTNTYSVDPTSAVLKVYKKVYATGSTAEKIIKLNSAKSEEE